VPRLFAHSDSLFIIIIARIMAHVSKITSQHWPMKQEYWDLRFPNRIVEVWIESQIES